VSAWRRSTRVLLAAAVLGAAVAGGRAEDDPVSARVFEVHYRPLADAAELVDPLLSAEGTLTLRPRLSALVIQDHRSVLDRAAAALASFDLPPRAVEVTFSLFLGSDRSDRRPGAGPELTREVRGVLETLSDFTRWNTYEPLGSRSVQGVRGERVVTDLSDDYRVVFVIDSVHQTQGTTRFERLQLQQVRRDAEGQERVRDLYTMGAVVPPNKLYVVGAAIDPDSKRALFLTLQTRPR